MECVNNVCVVFGTVHDDLEPFSGITGNMKLVG